ncbi:RB1-inducible coiled-coil protein 1-like [Dendronephthya gigantea]|uniref:RB1-inducible coiled-coil protein 1-like n=1 Tax=Dendronephthya gigantea TaxID=151771 RepID=UPI001068F59F|nr:RB1-inducible coiled-coil protein 1-like [Dendronephthya gigantea]
MLYVFLVDTGAMLTFEMELAMESVEELMKSITSTFMIPLEKQVLIMQGGEALDPKNRICNYSSAGTEHNPIFLFSKTTIESPMPPSPSLNLGSEMSLKEEVEKSLLLPPTYETLVSRAKLAMRFQDMGAELLQSCVTLINEQHLQRQGWLAVVANLESIASKFETRGSILEQNYTDFLKIIPEYRSLLDSFQDVIDQLSKLPVFLCLIKDDMKSLISTDGVPTLLDWINAQDERNSLEDMVRQCIDALGQFQNSSLVEIKNDQEHVLGDVSNKNIKEIGGLEERLSMLSHLCDKANSLGQEQSDMAQGFSQNQVRAQNIGDPSVLPDLCSSHQAQLSLMMHNHTQLRDIRRKCAKAKDELSVNLHARLRWVMMIEKNICDCDNKLVMYHESMKRMKKRVEILEQIKDAPRIYAMTVKEVVRRREFSSQFSKWAKDVSQQSNGVYKQEIASRQDYLDFVGNHFLKNLFTGIDDMPTQFVPIPEDFDNDLPPLTCADLQELRNLVPNIFDKQSIRNKPGEDVRIITFGKSLSCNDLPSVNEFVMKSSLDEMDGKMDNRTKVIGKSNEMERISVTTQTMERHDILSSNIAIKERLLTSINTLRSELQQLRETTTSWDESVKNYVNERLFVCEEFKLNERLRLLAAENDSKSLKELTNSLDAMKKKISSLNSENESLRKEIEARDTSFSEKEMRYRNDLERQKQYATELESAKETFEAEQQIRFNSAIGRVMKEKENALKKADEQLTSFKLSQEKKDEKLQVLFNEKETLRQGSEEYARKIVEAQIEIDKMKKEMERYIMETQIHLEEKERQFNEKLEHERKESALMLETERQKWETDSSGSGSGQIISELVEARLNKRIKLLEEENSLLRDRLKSGPDCDEKLLFVELQQSLDEKCKECIALQDQLKLLQQKPRSSQVVSKDLQKGDIVEVYYNDPYELYMIRSEGETLYFVHPDSLVNIDLPELKSRHTFHAQILDKEYCQAKKANNRFKVTAGTKFYRVKVRPWDPSSSQSRPSS